MEERIGRVLLIAATSKYLAWVVPAAGIVAGFLSGHPVIVLYALLAGIMAFVALQGLAEGLVVLLHIEQRTRPETQDT